MVSVEHFYIAKRYVVPVPVKILQYFWFLPHIEGTSIRIFPFKEDLTF